MSFHVSSYKIILCVCHGTGYIWGGGGEEEGDGILFIPQKKS